MCTHLCEDLGAESVTSDVEQVSSEGIEYYVTNHIVNRDRAMRFVTYLIMCADLCKDLGAESGACDVEQVSSEGLDVAAVVDGNRLQALFRRCARFPVTCNSNTRSSETRVQRGTQYAELQGYQKHCVLPTKALTALLLLCTSRSFICSRWQDIEENVLPKRPLLLFCSCTAFDLYLPQQAWMVSSTVLPKRNSLLFYRCAQFIGI